MVTYFYSTTIPVPNGTFRASGIVQSNNVFAAYDQACKMTREKAYEMQIKIVGELTLDTFNKVS